MNFFNDENGKSWLKELLRQNGAEISFIKADGTERLMKCTLNENKIPQEFIPKGVKRSHSDETLAVFDIESQGWRSFRWDSVKSVSFPIND